MRALLLPVGEDTYAVPMDVAREVIVAPTVTTLPTAPPSVLGVCNVRGEIVPVFDTGILLGLGPLESVRAVTLVDADLGPAALAVSGIGASVELDDPVAVTEAPGTAGAFVYDDGLAVLVDVDVLLAPARLG